MCNPGKRRMPQICGGLGEPGPYKRPRTQTKPRDEVRQKKKGRDLCAPFSDLEIGLWFGLAVQQRRHDHFFRTRLILGHLDFQLAHWELPPGVFSLDPNLVEEVFVANAVKDQLGGLRRFGDVAGV